MDAVSYSHSAKQAQRIKKIIANPDSTSGVVTVPSTIATGETITIPAGRTAILPDVTVEGDLLVNGTVFIPTGTTYTQQTVKTEAISNVAGTTVVNVTDVVSKVGDQTIAGTKTFSTSPLVPTPTAGDNSTKVATTAFCTSQDIGVGQTWQDVKASRLSGVTYPNTTGKPITLLISVLNNSATNYTTFFWVNGVNITKVQNVFNGDVIDAVSIIVPDGSTYKVTASVALTVQTWFELR